jgi:hypothetical protein
MLVEYLDFILNTPGCYTIGLGDYLECATKTSVGLGMYEEEFHFPEQYEMIEKMLKPLAKAKKIIGLHPGNHEYRATLATGMDPVKQLAKNLKVPYLGYTAFYKWVVGDVVYNAIMLHGRSGAKTASGRLNAVRGLRDIGSADLYIMGHLHDRQTYRDVVYEINNERDIIDVKNRYYIIAGGFLEWFGSYADMMALPPIGSGLVEINLDRSKKKIDVVLSTTPT